jgi:two-component system response regulator YesN
VKVYTCIAVDDEPLVLDRLNNMFDKWNKIKNVGYVLSGCCHSADEGIELALRIQPDIIITDIVMPGRNGMDMIAVLKSQLPHTIFIILSAYSNFEYARQAIAMDVLEFLVKVPLREQDLLEALGKAKLKLDKQERSRLEISRLNQERREHIYRLRKQIMEEICLRQTPPGELDRLRNSLWLDIPVGIQPVCMAMKLDRYAEFQSLYRLSDQKLLKYGIINIIEETIQQEEAGGFCCELGTSRFIVVVYWTRLRSRHQMEAQSSIIAGRMVANIKQFLKLSVSVGFSDVRASKESLADAWKEADDRLDRAFYAGSGSVIIPSVSMPAASVQPSRFEAYFDSLYTALIKKDRPAAENLLDDIQKNAEQYQVAPALLLALISGLAAKLNKASDSKITSMDQDEIDFQLFLVELRSLCEASLNRVQTNSWEREEIRKSKAYIEAHLASDIYLEDIAGHVNLNSAYLSKLFKREMKEGLSEYMNRRRIECAVELLGRRNYSNIELAEAVGIHNERYFCTLFKKYVGTTPQKFNPQAYTNSHATSFDDG